MSLIDRVSAKAGKPPKPRAASPQEAAQRRRTQPDDFHPSDFEDTEAALDEIAAWEEAFLPREASAPVPKTAPASRGTGELMSRVVSRDEPAGATAKPAAPGIRRDDGRRSREFEFDFRRLQKFGFITPQSRRSRISEEFRLIKRRLMQRMSLSEKRGSGKRARNSGREHVILVTSARPSEGKSFVAMNLALSIVLDEGLNVMLVDGDVARPSISKILGLRNDLPGLTDLLMGEAEDLPSVLLREETRPFSYLAAGAVVQSATDLFGGADMRRLVQDMASRYSDRIIIFDAPPLLASTEPVALAEHVGQVVMVVDAEKTSRTAVDSALDLLESDRNVNLVLNKTAVRNRTEQFGSYYEAYNQAGS